MFPRGAEWMIRDAEKHHPLGFKQHCLEDAGMYFLDLRREDDHRKK